MAVETNGAISVERNGALDTPALSPNVKTKHRNNFPHPTTLDEFTPPGGSTSLRIRRYREGDRARVREICCDTGCLGQPIDTMFADRALFADLITGPYLEHEPEWALVVENNDRVVGYLLGSTRRDFDRQLMRSGSRVAWKMLWRLITGHYREHRNSGRFVRWVLLFGFHERPKHPRHAAHLHFDLEEEFRGLGVGRRLWNIYEDRLRDAGVKRCYGEFFSYPERRPEVVYARYGFSVFDRHRTTLFAGEIPNPVEIVCAQKTL